MTPLEIATIVIFSLAAIIFVLMERAHRRFLRRLSEPGVTAYEPDSLGAYPDGMPPAGLLSRRHLRRQVQDVEARLRIQAHKRPS